MIEKLEEFIGGMVIVVLNLVNNIGDRRVSIRYIFFKYFVVINLLGFYKI